MTRRVNWAARWSAGALAAMLLLAQPQRAWAVIVYNTTQNTSPAGFPFSQLNNVGSQGVVGSAVYLGQNAQGDHWAITASHLGVGNVTIGGTTYQPVPGSPVQLTNTGIGGLAAGSTDLTMFRLQSGPALANLSIATFATHSNATLLASPVYVIGNGRNVNDLDANLVPDERDFNAGFQDITPNVTPAFEGFRHQSPTTFSIRWGTNVLNQVAVGIDLSGDSIPDLAGMISDFTDPDVAGETSFESQATFGDSGGAVFDAGGTLLGLIHTQGAEPGQPANINLYGNESAFSDVRFYQPQIAQIFNTPEPASLVLAVLAALAVVALAWSRSNKLPAC
jgi:hypothetical protein